MKYTVLSAALLYAAAAAAQADPSQEEEKGHYLRKHICGGLPLVAVGLCRVYESLGCVTRKTDDDCVGVEETFFNMQGEPLPQLVGCDEDKDNGETAIVFQ